MTVDRIDVSLHKAKVLGITANWLPFRIKSVCDYYHIMPSPYNEQQC